MNIAVWVFIFSLFKAGEAIPFERKIVAASDEITCNLILDLLEEEFEIANDPRVRVEFGKCFKRAQTIGDKI